MNAASVAEVHGSRYIFYAGVVMVFCGVAISAYRYDPLLHPVICKSSQHNIKSSLCIIFYYNLLQPNLSHLLVCWMIMRSKPAVVLIVIDLTVVDA